MTLKVIVLSIALSVGFWALQRTWLWLGELRESLADEREEASVDC